MFLLSGLVASTLSLSPALLCYKSAVKNNLIFPMCPHKNILNKTSVNYIV